MSRIIAIYGIIAGAIVAVGMMVSMATGVAMGMAGMAIGYLTMLIALSMVFAGIKRYRDVHCGGAIRFSTALGVGLGISVIATLFYVVGWEIYLYGTDYQFMPDYIAATLEAKRQAGANAAELKRMAAEMQGYLTAYADPVTRVLMTFSEIAPVALLMTLISALLLRRPGFMPARPTATL